MKTNLKKEKNIDNNIYDLVNSGNMVICTGSKKDAKQKRLWRRIVHIFVINKKGELLICKRPNTVHAYPNLWTSSAGGHVECKESFHASAKRELFEELGISTSLHDMGRFDVVSSHGRLIHHLFVTRAEYQDIIPEKKEISSYTFATMNHLRHATQTHPHRYAFPFRKAYSLYIQQSFCPIPP